MMKGRIWSGKQRLLAGLMCGTSGDGISAAVIETEGYGRERGLRVLAHDVFPYSEEVRTQLFSLFPPHRFTAVDLAHLHRALGEALADAALGIAASAGRAPEELRAIAVQAPTLFHEQPAQGRDGVHMEIGESAIISERTGAVVVSDLRPSDVAAGGHGAPLSAFVDWALLTDDTFGRAVQNIGGIANVTFLPPRAAQEDVVCFDTGPGNMVIDGVVEILSGGREAFDRDGQRAGRGSVNEELLSELVRHPYLQRRPPKTTGREEFGQHFAEQTVERGRALGIGDDDLVATVTVYTVECIGLHYDRELRPRGRLDEVVLYGGGAHNRMLVTMLRERIAPTPVRLQDEFGIPGDAREAVTWAVLADETLAGRPANIPAASGATHAAILGKLVRVHPEGESWRTS
jgi:anhydro-N-acetylmuramic acid kinase